MQKRYFLFFLLAHYPHSAKNVTDVIFAETLKNYNIVRVYFFGRGKKFEV